MHIALVSPAWPLGVAPNGIVTYVHVLRRELISRGHAVSVFANVVGTPNIDPDVHLVKESAISSTLRRLKNILGIRQDYVLCWGRIIGENIAKIHRRNAIDIIEMEESYGWCAHV